MSSTPSPILTAAETKAASSRYAQIVKGLELDSVDVKAKPPNDLRESGAARNSESADPFRVCKDGERTEHLTRLAGTWIAQGKTIDEVKLLALGWNSRNTPPLDEDKVWNTCESILATHTRNHPDDSRYTPLTPLFDLASASVATLLDAPPPPRRWLFDKLIPLDIVAMLVGQGGSSKSMLALQMALSVVTGDPFLDGRKVPEPGAALLLFAEDDKAEIHRRLHTAIGPLRQKDPKLEALVKQRLYIKSLVVESNLMTAGNYRGEVTSTGYVDRLILTARGIPDLRLVVVDPASRFRGGDENTAQDATRFVEQLERLRAATGATVLVLHHANKGAAQADEATQGASRGSSAMTDGVRWQMNLNKPTKNEAKSYGMDEMMRKNFVIATVTKNNYGPPQDPLVLHRGDYGLLEISSSAARTTNRMSDLVEAVKSEAAEGRTYTPSSFEKEIAGESGPLKLGKVTVRNLIKQAVAEGYLKKNLRTRHLSAGPKKLD